MSLRYSLRTAALVSAFGIVLAATSALPAPPNAFRSPLTGSALSMEIIVDGKPLPEYAANGTTYVEALKVREHAVRLSNRTGERMAVALAVDGLNAIDARHTTSTQGRKWIVGPWDTITLSGWQTSSDTARRFVFTSEPGSYGAWLGRIDDLGVISAAFFREARRPDPINAPTTSAPPASLGGVARSARSAEPKDDRAATGIGEEMDHRVVLVEFDEQDTPAATISLRYEFRDALARLGVIPAGAKALDRRERAQGFAEPGFAPDPHRARR